MIVPVNIVAVQVNQNNSLFVTTGVDYDSDGAVVGSEIIAQYTLNPGDDLTGQPVEVVNIANALWTPAVVEAYKLANPAVVSEKPSPIAEPVVIAENVATADFIADAPAT
jgi:hypothetical protein